MLTVGLFWNISAPACQEVYLLTVLAVELVTLLTLILRSLKRGVELLAIILTTTLDAVLLMKKIK